MIGATVAQPDITLVLDEHGVIAEARLANSVAGEEIGGWIGRFWFETVGDTANERVRRMIADARATGLSAFGQVTQHFPSGRALPIEYVAATAAGRAGLIAVGKSLQSVTDLRAQLVAVQQAREQEYWKLREVETRCRLLFDASEEAVLVVRADSLRITELNGAAARDLGLTADQELLEAVAPWHRAALQGLLDRVQVHGRAPGIILHFGATGVAWTARASLLTAEPGTAFMLQLAPVAAIPGHGARAEAALMAELVERLPDAVVVLDKSGIIRRANAAFLALAQVGVEAAVLGERLSRWLAFPGSDAALFDTIQRNRTMRLFPTSLRGELGTEFAVELAAVGDRDRAPRFYGVVLRDVTRRLGRSAGHDSLATALGAVSGRVGTEPMLHVVRDVVETVERFCITDALDRAGGNRTAAAELLGLSRQSLHLKLNRYGLDGGGSTPDKIGQNDRGERP